MSRGNRTSIGRCTAVWLVVTAAALTTWSAVAGTAASLGSATTWHGTFEELLVAVASAALGGCLAWLWLVTSLTVVEVLRGRAPLAVPHGLTRRLVLAACGAAVVAGVGSPALAGAVSGEPSLVGLPLPDRAVTHARILTGPPVQAPPPRPDPPRTITVRTGDSLWTIAAHGLSPGADRDEIDAAWRALYAANRDLIGTDPDLIRPGLVLEAGPRSHREARR